MRATTKGLLLASFVALVVLVPTTAGGQSDPPQQMTATPPTPLPVTDHRCPRGLSSVSEYRAYAKRVYLRGRVSRDALRRMAYMVKCQHASAWARLMVRRYWKRFVRDRVARRLSEAVTPYACSFGRSAIPCSIVMCESRGSWSAYNASGARGRYQLLGHGEPWPANTAWARAMHDRIAAALWQGGAGAHHWAQCLGR